MRKFSLILLYFLVSVSVHAALRITAASIPGELRNNASSVVRADLTTYKLKPNGTAVEVGMRVITILEPSGRESAKFECISSRDANLKKFSATTYDRYGKKVLTEGKKQLKVRAYLPDYKQKNVEQVYHLPTPASYPFTVVYHWERSIKDGSMNFPLFMPQKSFNQSVEYAEYTLSVPNGFPTKRLPIRHEENYAFSTAKKMDNHTFKMENLPAFVEDPFSKELFEIVPVMVINPKVMRYMGVEREINSWDDFAQFSYQVLDTLGTLSEADVARVKYLTDSLETIEEKFWILNDSISINVPYAAWDDLRGFYPLLSLGDWKYATKADSRMMAHYWWSIYKHAGIPVDYVAANSWEEELHEQVPNLHQFNSALLRVRLPKDTLWVDFSSPDLPAGYFNSKWRGINWLSIGTDGNHEFVYIPTLSDTINKQTSHNVIYVEASGKATMQFQRISYAMQYEQEKNIMMLTGKKREKAIASTLAIPSVVRNVTMTEHKDPVIPSIVMKANLLNGQFATKIGNTLYMYSNVQHLGFKMDKSHREEGDDIVISRGYCNQDTVDIYPPKGYFIDRVPKEREYKTPYGHFYFSFEPLPHQGVRLIYYHEMRQGTYSAATSREFLKFLRNVTDSYSDRIFMKRDE